MEFLNEHQKGRFSLLYSINTLSVIHFYARQRNNAYSSCEKIDFPSCQTYVIICQWHGSTQVSVHMINKCALRTRRARNQALSFQTSNGVLSANNTFYLHPRINRSVDKKEKQIVEDLSCRYCESLKNARMEKKKY